MRPNRITVVCQGCGDDFLVRPSTLKVGKGKFCSRACYAPHHAPKKTEAEFWAGFERVGQCLLWQGGKDGKGYGRVSYAGKSYKVHRLAWILSHPDQPIPPGLNVLHNCPGGDNPACGNPEHLWLGTIAENQQDAANKKRLQHGDNHWTRRMPERLAAADRSGVLRGENANCAVLTEAQVIEIKARYKPRVVTLKMLSQEYGVSIAAISYIITGRNWKHVA